jgi:hypothetical protein
MDLQFCNTMHYAGVASLMVMQSFFGSQSVFIGKETQYSSREKRGESLRQIDGQGRVALKRSDIYKTGRL